MAVRSRWLAVVVMAAVLVGATMAFQADPWKVLGLEKGASDKEVKRKYHKMSLRYHPDKNKGSTDAAAKFIEIQEAYEILTDPEKRAEYERSGAYHHQYHGRGGGPRGRGHPQYYHQYREHFNIQSVTTTLTDRNFDEVVSREEGVVLVQFFTHWNRDCHFFSKAWETAAAHTKGYARLVRVVADQSPSLSEKYNIRRVPTTLAFYQGKPRRYYHGAWGWQALVEFVTSTYPADITALADDRAAQRFLERAKPGETSIILFTKRPEVSILYQWTAWKMGQHMRFAIMQQAAPNQSNTAASSSIRKLPSVAVYHNDGPNARPTVMGPPFNKDKLLQFIRHNKYGQAPQLQHYNMDELCRSKYKRIVCVVLVISSDKDLSPSGASGLVAIRTAMKKFKNPDRSAKMQYAWVDGRRQSAFRKFACGEERELCMVAIDLEDGMADTYTGHPYFYDDPHLERWLTKVFTPGGVVMDRTDVEVPVLYDDNMITAWDQVVHYVTEQWALLNDWFFNFDIYTIDGGQAPPILFYCFLPLLAILVLGLTLCMMNVLCGDLQDPLKKDDGGPSVPSRPRAPSAVSDDEDSSDAALAKLKGQIVSLRSDTAPSIRPASGFLVCAPVNMKRTDDAIRRLELVESLQEMFQGDPKLRFAWVDIHSEGRWVKQFTVDNRGPAIVVVSNKKHATYREEVTVERVSAFLDRVVSGDVQLSVNPEGLWECLQE